VFGWIGPLPGLAAMSAFLFAYAVSGGGAGAAREDARPLYIQATTMTMAGIVMAQVGAGIGWRTNRQPVAEIGLLSNRLLLVGIAVEVAMIAMLAYTPGLQGVFHTGALGPWHWLFLLAWPPVVLAAEEARKAVVRGRMRRAPT
jgi:magnesium-transporting ATPase (P-type)